MLELALMMGGGGGGGRWWHGRGRCTNQAFPALGFRHEHIISLLLHVVTNRAFSRSQVCHEPSVSCSYNFAMNRAFPALKNLLWTEHFLLSKMPWTEHFLLFNILIFCLLLSKFRYGPSIPALKISWTEHFLLLKILS